MNSKFFVFLSAFVFSSNLFSTEKTESQIVKVVKQTVPSVVGVHCQGSSNINPFADDPLFGLFFGIQARPTRSSGSGVIIDPRGYVVTCAHVVSKAENITVTLTNGIKFKAEIVSIDDRSDLAIIKIDMKKDIMLNYLKVSDTKLDVGEEVIAIGNSFGLDQTVTKGIVSALYRLFGGRIMNQTDAAINPGNSGGPIITMDGRLAGIANAIATKSGASHGVGFFTPAEAISRFIDVSINNLKNSYIPVDVQTADSSIVEALNSHGIYVTGGVVVNEIDDKNNSIEHGDVIISIDNHEVYNKEMFEFFSGLVPCDQYCQIAFIKSKDIGSNEIKISKTSIKSLEKKSLKDQINNGKFEINDGSFLNNVIISEINDELSKTFDVKDGVFVLDANKNSIVKEKDILLEINGNRIKNIQDVLDALKSSKRGFSVTIKRDNAILKHTVIG